MLLQYISQLRRNAKPISSTAGTVRPMVESAEPRQTLTARWSWLDRAAENAVRPFRRAHQQSDQDAAEGIRKPQTSMPYSIIVRITARKEMGADRG